MIELDIYVEMLLVILINGNHELKNFYDIVFFPKSIQTSFMESKKTFLISRIMNIPVY